MISILAAQKAPPPEQAAIQDFLGQINQWLVELPDHIDLIDPGVAGVLLILGIVSLLYGLRIVKGVVIVYSSIVGSALGLWLTNDVLVQPDYWWIGLIAGGLVMGILAWPLANVFIGIYGAMAGGLAGYAVTHAVGDERLMVLGVVLGMIFGGVLAAMVFRFMVIVTTSVLGAHLAVVGTVALLYCVDRISGSLHQSLESQQYLLPLLTAVPALIGIVYQLYRGEEADGADDAAPAKAKG
jgi:hypothetical protein